MTMHTWHVYDEFGQAAYAAADFIANTIEVAIQQRDNCHVILPGGNTPVTSLAYLAKRPLRWERVHWYLGDERCYPCGHKERNDVMLQRVLWSQFKQTCIHTIPAELGPEPAADEYRHVIDAVDCFDLAFLGIGEDGHTASLFPANPAIEDPRSVVPVYRAPKQPQQRVSLGISTLQAVNKRVVLAGGRGKAEVIKRVRQGEDLPINSVGDIEWFVDRAATSGQYESIVD